MKVRCRATKEPYGKILLVVVGDRLDVSGTEGIAFMCLPSSGRKPKSRNKQLYILNISCGFAHVVSNGRCVVLERLNSDPDSTYATVDLLERGLYSVKSRYDFAGMAVLSLACVQHCATQRRQSLRVVSQERFDFGQRRADLRVTNGHRYWRTVEELLGHVKLHCGPRLAALLKVCL